MTDQISAYRQRVLAAHPTEFDLHTRTATVLEQAVQRHRETPTIVHLVLDMLMVQCTKAHAAVSLLAQHGLLEDTATLARRLLELSVQAVYIGAESEEPERLRRAGRFLVFMWRQIPEEKKQGLPSHLRDEWLGYEHEYGPLIPAKAVRWGPTYRAMFEAVGAEDLYVKDYSFLSSITHGTAASQVFQWAVEQVRIHRHDFAPVLLIYSSRYYLAAAEHWNRAFSLVDETVLQPLVAEVVAWRRSRGTDQ